MITDNVYSEYNLSEIRGLEYELKIIHFGGLVKRMRGRRNGIIKK